MKSLLLAALVSVAASCSQWPNGTDTRMNWWQCSSGPLQVYNATPFDNTGKYEYPVHLGQPLIMQMNINNPKSTYTKPNLRDTINIWEWEVKNCGWNTIPTLGLLNNQDACANGISCPVNPGKQWLKVVIDFTPYKTIINLLQDNTAYQIEYSLLDKVTGDRTCLMFQARAYIH